MAEGLSRVWGNNVLILAAGRMGKARSRHLQNVVDKIAEMKDKGGGGIG